MPNKVIAIDGPSASGKSTVARKVGARLGYKYVDSGALYRGLAWKVTELGGHASDPVEVIAMIKRIKIKFFIEDEAVRYKIDGYEPREEIRSEKVNESVSFVAAIPEIRAQVTQWLQEMIKFGNLVMEGRDIGTVVFPDAVAKFYLDASPEERARRRHAEFNRDTAATDVGRVMVSLTNRDKRDSDRKTAPLKLAEDAQVVDTTGLIIDQVVDEIVKRIGK